MKTIGFFGGTFDPIHFGHIGLALQLQEEHHLDEVLFCPAFCSPFKTASPPAATPHHRLEMLRLGLEGIPHFQTTSIEIDRKGTSYTIDTIRSLQKEGVLYRLLLSSETATQFDLWKESAELRRIAPPLIGARCNPCSSTEIRDRLRKRLYCGHLIPAKTLDYIQRHNLYSGT